MRIAATVENGTIKLPPDIHLPDGTKVECVVPLDERLSVEDAPPAVDDDDPHWMRQWAGCIVGLPEDLSDEPDHFLYGTPKRAGR